MVSNVLMAIGNLFRHLWLWFCVTIPLNIGMAWNLDRYIFMAMSMGKAQHVLVGTT